MILSPDTWAKLDAPEPTPTPPPAAAVSPPLPSLVPVPTPLPYEKPKPWVKVPPPPESRPPSDRKFLGIVVDVAVVLILLVLGVIAGEFAAGKSTREVMAGASGPKFPPIDLLMWLAGPVFFLLIYAWLGTRGRTLGGWLRRRTG